VTLAKTTEISALKCLRLAARFEKPSLLVKWITEAQKSRQQRGSGAVTADHTVGHADIEVTSAGQKHLIIAATALHPIHLELNIK